MVILDTNHMSLLERKGSPPTNVLMANLEKVPDDEVVTTIISFEEQVRGWLSVLAKARKIQDQIEAYRRLNGHLENYCNLTVLGLDANAAVEFQRLRKSLRRIGTMDLKIAAIAICQNATLLTRNSQDFAQVPGLQFGDWTK